MQDTKSYYNIKMTQKEYLINILNNLSEKRPVAKSLIVLIANNEINNTIIIKIIDILKKELKNTSKTKDKQTLNDTINYLEKLKEREDLSKQEDAEALEELDDMLGIK